MALNWFDFLKENIPMSTLFFIRPHITIKFIDKLKQLYNNVFSIYYLHDLHGLRNYLEENPKCSLKDQKKLSCSTICDNNEQEIIPRVDKAITPSQKEEEILGQYFDNVKSIPLMAADILYEKLDLDQLKFDVKNTSLEVIFVGGFSHKPNLEVLMDY